MLTYCKKRKFFKKYLAAIKSLRSAQPLSTMEELTDFNEKLVKDKLQNAYFERQKLFLLFLQKFYSVTREHRRGSISLNTFSASILIGCPNQFHNIIHTYIYISTFKSLPPTIHCDYNTFLSALPSRPNHSSIQTLPTEISTILEAPSWSICPSLHTLYDYSMDSLIMLL